MSIRKANAEWRGNLTEGSGDLSTESGILNKTPYNFVSRFQDGKQTNPEELVGAAHAGCFTMALANSLSKDGFKVNSVKTEDKVHFEKVDAGFKITTIDVITVGDVEGIDAAKFQKYAEDTKKTCIVSRALTGVEFTLDAKLK